MANSEDKVFVVQLIRDKDGNDTSDGKAFTADLETVTLLLDGIGDNSLAVFTIERAL